MIIKVFTLNENNKIELTKEELENLLNEVYLEKPIIYNNGISSISPNPTTVKTTMMYDYDTYAHIDDGK